MYSIMKSICKYRRTCSDIEQFRMLVKDLIFSDIRISFLMLIDNVLSVVAIYNSFVEDGLKAKS